MTTTGRRCSATGTPSPTSKATCWRTRGSSGGTATVAAVPWRTRGHVARRIDGFARQLEPLARTPYLLVPDRHGLQRSHRRFARSPRPLQRRTVPADGNVDGACRDWTTTSNLLGATGKSSRCSPSTRIPTGWASTRRGPELKQRPTRIARALLLAESLSALAPARSGRSKRRFANGWQRLVLMNHHDAITGTSPDRVSHDEQRRWLAAAEAAATVALSRASAGASVTTSEQVPSTRGAGLRRVRFWRRASELHVQTAHHRLTFSKERGGCLTVSSIDGSEQLEGWGSICSRSPTRAGYGPGPRVPGRSVRGSRPREPKAGPDRNRRSRRCRHGGDHVRPARHAVHAEPSRAEATTPLFVCGSRALRLVE